MGQQLTPALRCGAGYLGQGAAIDVQALVGVKVASSMVSVDYAPQRMSTANGVRGRSSVRDNGSQGPIPG